ncbi:thiol reductant ABC exporter subunit CydC [Kytococcus sedentarius]|uniref:thiol reductant ABC exporter subunit CydC n=1 Tax=Kytococcus sedentarius TaxID=1276 RepID=UPI0035BBAC01
MKPFDPRLLRLLPHARKEVAAVAFPVVLQGVVAVLQALAVAWLATAVTASVYATLTGQPTPPSGIPDDPDPTLGEIGPFVVPSGLSTGSDAGSVTSLLAPAVAVAVLLAVRGLLAGWVHHRSAVAGARVAAELRRALAARWLAGGPGRSSTQLTAGVGQVEPYVASFLPSLVAAGAVPVLVWLTLAWVDLFSAVVVLLTLPLLPLFAALIGASTADETAKRWRALDALAGHFLDVMRGLPTLVNLGRAEQQVRTIEEVGQRHRRATVTTLRTAFLTTAAMELLSTISVAIVAVFVGLRLAHGDIGLMVGLAAILLAPEAYWPVRRVGADFHAAADGVETLDAVLPLLEEPVRQGAGGGQTGPADPAMRHATLHAGGVRHTHPDGPTVRLAEDWSLPETGLVAVTGPSGAGKSTLLWLLAGLLDPTEGRVTAPRSHLVTQRPYLPRGGVEAALRITPAAADASPDRLRAVVERVGLLTTLEQLPEGWATDLGDDGQGLSAGERARLGLARALLDDAPVLLLDEPTAHLDTATAELVHRVLLEESTRRLVVVATHRQELARVAGWHVGVDAGRVALPEPVATTPAVTAPAVHPASTASPTSPTSPPGPDARASRADEAGLAASARGNKRLPVVTTTPKLWRAALVGALSSLAGVALTATSGWLIVRAWEQPVVLMLMMAIVGVRTFGLARPVLRYAERLDSHDVALDQLAGRRAETYRRLVPLTPARLGRRGRARVLTGVVADLDDVVMAAVRWWVPLVGALLTGLVAAALLAVLSPLIGALVALQTLLVVGGSALVERQVAGAQQRELAARGRVWEAAHTAADRSDELRAVNGQDTALQAVTAADRDVVRWVRRRAAGQAVVRAASWLLAGVVVAVAAVIAPSAGWSGPLVALLVLTPLALADVLGGVPDAVSAHSRARVATGRLEALLGQEPAVAQAGGQGATAPVVPGAAGASVAPVSPSPQVALDSLVARWTPDAEPTVDGLDLDLAPGTRVALTGPSGAGKSTVLAVLARHLDPAGGAYTLDGHDVLDLPLASTRATVALLDDSPHVFSSTLRENLRTARPGASDAELESVLADAGLGTFLAELPEGLDTMIGSAYRAVSGGEQARIGLARILLSERPVVLLDEPVAHLDGPTAQAVMNHLGTATEGRSVVLVSHRTEGHQWCDAQVRLERPALVASRD